MPKHITVINSDRQLFSLRQAAKYLGISSWAIKEMVRHKQIPSVRVGKKYLIDRRALENWVARKAQWAHNL